MNRIRIISLALCAAMLAGLLAGCSGSSTAASSSSSSSASSTASSAASESIPSSTTRADTSGLRPNFDENSLFTVDGTADAFEPCLGWGPGVSGCSLKSVIAAASLLQWAENTKLSLKTSASIEDAYNKWYDSLSSVDQENFAEAWPLIREDANTMLTDIDSMSGRIEDAGLDISDLPGCSEENWEALQDVLDELVPEAQGEY